MTASSFDPCRTPISRVVLLVWACGCRVGLPPEPAGRDAADATAPVPQYAPRPSPYQTSAFEGVRLDAGGGHEHMHHGPKPEPAAAHSPREGSEVPK